MAQFSALTDAAVGVPGDGTAPGASARLRQVADEHFEPLWRSLRRLGVPEADVDDALQQVFLAVAPRLDGLAPGRERAYLLGVAYRVASNWRRTHRRRREVFDATLPDESDASGGPDATLEQKQMRQLLDRVLDALPHDLRAVFVLFELEELPMTEIAQLLGIPPGTVASRLRRAREQFQAQAQAVLGDGGAR